MIDLNGLPLPRLFGALVADGSLDRLLEAARIEDLGAAGDVTSESAVEATATCRATAVAREPGVVAGLAAVPRALEVFGCAAGVEFLAADGEACSTGSPLWRISGPRRAILGAERTVLNLLGRLSGVATLTRRFVREVAGTAALVCDTRKTTPGLRSLEKYAVRCGGGTLHRIGLHDAVLIKDNHMAGLAPPQFAGLVYAACRRARDRHDLRFVEVEVESLDRLRALLDAGRIDEIDIVLLDNMEPDAMRRAVALRDAAAPRLLLEASGGISLAVARAVAETGVDRIAVGALTRSARWLDVALEVEA